MAGATLSPGNSVGVLTLDGSELDAALATLTMRSGSTLLMEVAGPAPTDNDILNVYGTFVLEEGAIIQIALAENSSLVDGDIFEAVITATDGIDEETIFNALRSNDFTGLTVIPNGTTFTITGAYVDNSVPEPSTWALLLVGTAGLFWLRRKNNSQKNS